MTCERNVFEPTLSYATLSEFNIDQVALTTQAKRDAVKVKFEAATERQQRVVEAIRAADEDAMRSLVLTASTLIETLNSTFLLCGNTTLLSIVYKTPDIVNADNEMPEKDRDFVSERIDTVARQAERVTISFEDTQRKLGELLEPLFGYDEGSSVVLDTIQGCLDAGLDGSGEKKDHCEPPPGPPAPGPPFEPPDYCHLPGMEDFCFLEKYERWDEEIFRKAGSAEEIISTATTDLTILDNYNSVIEWTFENETLPASINASHMACQSKLSTYQTTVLLTLISFVNAVSGLENVSTLQESKNLITSLRDTVNNSLGPYLLEDDEQGFWSSPFSGPPPHREDDHSIDECAWYEEIYSSEIRPFGWGYFYLGESGKITSKHNSVKTKFASLVDQLGKMVESYTDNLQEVVQQVEAYLARDIEKKQLAETLSDQSLTRSISELSTLNNDLKTNIKYFTSAYQMFPPYVVTFYRELMSSPFPFILDSTRANYTFLQDLMGWYDNLGGRELIRNYLQEGETLDDNAFPPDANLTVKTIWTALVPAVEGFEEDGDGVTGLSGLTGVLNGISVTATRFTTQLDVLIFSMSEYTDRISMNTDFYMYASSSLYHRLVFCSC